MGRLEVMGKIEELKRVTEVRRQAILYRKRRLSSHDWACIPINVRLLVNSLETGTDLCIYQDLIYVPEVPRVGDVWLIPMYKSIQDDPDDPDTELELPFQHYIQVNFVVTEVSLGWDYREHPEVENDFLEMNYYVDMCTNASAAIAKDLVPQEWWR